MLIVTWLQIGMFLTLAYNLLGRLDFHASATLPNIDTTLLSAFGLGQGYLTKKTAANVGTVYLVVV